MEVSEFLILAFESSCDDTSVAIVDSNYRVVSNLISSQTIHQKYGGVVPELASRLHIKHLMSLTDLCLKESEMNLTDIDAVAVAVNPGLIGSLLVGTAFAKALSYGINKPLIAVNHMLGHIYANKIENLDLAPPYLALVVSGGHTELVHFQTEDQFEIIGRTCDDAAGEAFDKTAKLLGLGYPGGPILDRLSKEGDPNFFVFPRALKQKNNFNFSYSGLKTAILNYIQANESHYLKENLENIAASVQEAIIEPLVNKTIRYANDMRVGRIVLAGGVSANSRLRERMKQNTESLGIELIYPPLSYCMDNAAMIGAAAVDKYRKKDFVGLDLNPFSTKGLRTI